MYSFGGVTTTDPKDFYGKPGARLIKNRNGEWEIYQTAVRPKFEVEPQELEWDDFATKMKELGVRDELLTEFKNYQPDYTNF